MDKFVSVICTIQLLLVPAFSRRLQQSYSHRNVMAFRDGNSYVSCCFVDIFCYTSCFGGGGGLRAFVADDDFGIFRTSETRHHHRHRHHHGFPSFRTKRSVPDNILWEKLRQKFNTKAVNADKLDRCWHITGQDDISSYNKFFLKDNSLLSI